MNMRIVASVLLVALIVAAAFGVYLTFSPMHHGGGCPLASLEASLCGGSALTHISHWQSMFSTVIVNMLPFLALALAFALLAAMFAAAKKPYPVSRAPLTHVHAMRPDTTLKLHQKQFLDWLSLFENSPTYMRGA